MVNAQVLSETLRTAVSAAWAGGVSSATIVKLLADELDAHMQRAEEAAAVRVQTLYRGMRERRKQRQEALAREQTLPASLAGMPGHAYGTAVCQQLALTYDRLYKGERDLEL